ncbi:hypothetical protein PAMP_006949 [Pampus punctatissimus]
MKNKGTKEKKSKKKGSENAFGCDLIEHLQNSGQDVTIVPMTSFVSDKRLGGAAAYRGEKIMSQRDKKKNRS